MKMENALSVLDFNYETRNVRVVKDENNEPWFVAKDVCAVLGQQNSRDIIAKVLDDDEKGVYKVDTPGGPQEMGVVSESGLYTLILRSNKPKAKKFRKWITSEVLPEIRRTGSYQRRQYNIDDTNAYVPMDEFVGLQGKVIELQEFKIRVQEAQLNPPPRRKSRPLRDEDIQEIRRLKVEGLSHHKIAEKVGRSSATVSFVLRGIN
jgi:prophage antirepressor-like protein